MTVLDFNQRPILDMSVLCVPIEPLPKKLCFTMPGGLEICLNHGGPNMGLLQYCQQALNIANMAIAPLKPVLEVIDAVIAVFEVLKAVPDVVTNPQKVIELLQKLEEKIILVIKLLPPASVIQLALQVFDAFIETLDGYARELDALYSFAQRIESAQLSANKSPGLQDLISCSRASLNQQMDNMSTLFASLNGIIDIINFIAKLAGLKQLQNFGDRAGPGGTFGELPPEPAMAAAGLRSLVAELRMIRAAIPFFNE